MTDTTSVKHCAIKGCNNPRAVTKSGRVQTQCREHQHQGRKRADAKRTTCAHPGCTKPCAVSRNQKPYAYCIEHQRQRSNQYSKTWGDKHGDQPLTENQRRAGFDRDPQIARAKEETFKVCLINHDNKTMTFVEGRVTRRCGTEAVDLLPGGWELLLEGHSKSGYTIVERGTRPEGVRHAE